MGKEILEKVCKTKTEGKGPILDGIGTRDRGPVGGPIIDR